MKKISILLLLLIAVTFGACKKQTNSEQPKTFKTMNGTFVNMPTIEDGILTFADEAQYDAYLQMLNDAIENDPDEREADEILNDIEQSLGFNSYRKIKFDEFESLNAVGFSKLTDIPVQNDFSPLDMSVMNEYKEVKIAGDIYKNITKDYELLIKGDDPAKAAEILSNSRLLQEGGNTNITLSQIRALDWTMKHLSINDLSINGDMIQPAIEPTSEWELSGLVHTANECGGTYNKALIRSMTVVNTTTSVPVAAWYDVDYGDGATMLGYYGNGGMFGVEYIYDEHNYATSGTYTITIKARLTQNGPIVAQKSYQITVSSNTLCSDQEKSGVWMHSVDANNTIMCKISYWKMWRPRGKLCDIIGTIENYKKIGGVWKYSKAETLGVNLFAYTYKLNNSCELSTTKLDNVNNAKNNRKKVWTGREKMSRIKYIAIEGTYKVTVNGVTYTARYTMSSCD